MYIYIYTVPNFNFFNNKSTHPLLRNSCRSRMCECPRFWDKSVCKLQVKRVMNASCLMLGAWLIE